MEESSGNHGRSGRVNRRERSEAAHVNLSGFRGLRGGCGGEAGGGDAILGERGKSCIGCLSPQSQTSGLRDLGHGRGAVGATTSTGAVSGSCL